MVVKGLIDGNDAGIMGALNLWDLIEDRDVKFDVEFSQLILSQVKLIEDEQNKLDQLD